MKKRSKATIRKTTAVLLASALVAGVLPLTAQAGDTWPFEGNSAHGANQPNVHGYTSDHILNWSPERDRGSEMLRSRVPLQERIEPFAATQANPDLSSKVQYMNVAGDYGNAFIENAPYTNKFAQYHFNFWQYIDYYSYWHGTATAYTPPEYYDDLAQRDWQQKWFEFGMLNIPNPTYTDAAHKNGVMSLAGVFFSNNDRGQQTYKQMIIKDEDGNYPVAEKMIEMANYFGFDGYFINQEEQNPNVAVADIPDYIGFMKTLQEGGLYVQWYDSLNTSTGANQFARTFNNNNVSFLYDRTAGKEVSQSFFFDYGVGNNHINTANTFLSNLNAEHGTSYDLYDIGFAGLEAGRDRFKNVQGTALTNKLDSNGLPRLSIASLGADFVHAGLDEDMNLPWPNRHRAENDYQWMTKIREQLWWSGPNLDPKNTAKSATNTVTDVHADNRYWPGVASVMAERSVIGDTNFYTNFNTGHGLSYYVDGEVSNSEEWSNMSLQDVPVTWQWWQDTTGSRLTVDFDYGPDYNIDDTARFNYKQIGGYEGGSSLVVNGNLDADNFLRLYKTDLDVNAASKLSITYNKTSADDSSTMQVGLILADDPTNVVHIAVPDSGKQTDGWVTRELDLSAYAGKTIAATGLVFQPGDSAVTNYQMNVGQIRIHDGSAARPAAPSGLTISEAYTDTDEMVVRWNLDANYEQVKNYNVYVNDVFVGGKYDEVFYIKNLPAESGQVRVAAVGADGVEGEAATVSFDLNAAVSRLQVNSQENGQLTVSWTNPAAQSGPISVSIRSLNWTTTERPVVRHVIVPAGSTTAAFSGMPINGDDYIVTVSTGGHHASVSGNFIDKFIEPYAENWSWDGNRLNLPMPNTRDWRYMYVYEDGVIRSFPTTYSLGNRPFIHRGRTMKASLSFVSNAQTVYVVMEDNAGNKSEPLYLKNHLIFEAETGLKVAPGGLVDLSYGLLSNPEVLAQDVTFTYDADRFDFVSVSSLDEDQVKIVDYDLETPGTVRLLAVHLGSKQADPNGKLLKLTLQAKTDAASGPAPVSASAVVANGAGVERTHEARTLGLSIESSRPSRDSLDALISQAQAAHDVAREGNRVGEYRAGAKAALQAAIDAAKAVALDDASTATQIAQAESDLSTAIRTFSAAVITSVGGDQNQDHQLTVGDLAIIAKSYGMTSTDPEWDRVKSADLNGDGIIDIEDLVEMAKRILKW